MLAMPAMLAIWQLHFLLADLVVTAFGGDLASGGVPARHVQNLPAYSWIHDKPVSICNALIGQIGATSLLKGSVDGQTHWFVFLQFYFILTFSLPKLCPSFTRCLPMASRLTPASSFPQSPPLN